MTSEWEGEVVAVDVKTRRVKLVLQCVRVPGKPADLRPREVWVTVDKDAHVYMESDTGLDFDLTDLMEGYFARIQVTGSASDPHVKRMSVVR